MGIWRIIGLAVALAFGLGHIARADVYGSAMAAAVDSGRPRLALYALAFHNLSGSAKAIDALKSRYGLGPHSARDFGLGAAPLLYSDSNINGGTPGTVLIVGGVPFAIDAASRAVAGAVAGGRISGFARASPARGLVFDLSASAYSASALQRDDLGRRHGVAGHRIEGCAAAYLGRAQWMDFCASLSQTRRSMALSDLRSTALAYSRQFPLAGGFAEARAGAKTQETGGNLRPSLELGLTHASAGLGTLALRGEWFGRVTGQHGPLFSADIAMTRPIAGKTTTIFAAFAREGGAQFFGADRRDDVRSIGISRPISPRATLSLRWDDRKSSLSNYSQQGLGFELRLADLPF